MATASLNHRWLSEGAETLVREIEAAPASALHCEVLIVGSGYGGAVAAARLAGATRGGQPVRVFVLERGQELLPGQFPATFAELPGHVRFSAGDGSAARGRSEGVFDMRIGGDVMALVGNGLGGGSLINAAVMERPTADAFDDPRWPAGTGLVALDPWYRRAEAMLALQRLPESLPKLEGLLAAGHAMGAQEVRKAKVAVSFGGGATPAGVTMAPCKRCGDCVTGCNHQAKQSLDVNYLARARAHGARLFCGATVRRLRQIAGGFEVDFHFTDASKARSDRAPYKLRAERVIVAAGTFGSTEILLRSSGPELPLATAALGLHFSGNGDLIAVAYGQHKASPSCAHEGDAPDDRKVGPTITGLVRLDNGEHPLVFEEFAIPAPLRRLFGEVVATTDALHGMARLDRSEHRAKHVGDDPLAISDEALDHTMVYGMMANDGAQGRLELAMPDAPGDGHVNVKWPGAKHRPEFQAQVKALRGAHESAFGLGGHVLPNPLWQVFPEGWPLAQFRGPPLSVHPLGGCPMGDDAQRGVVDAFGRVFASGGGRIEGLAVLDGSIVPSALGINPSLTIAALAERAVPQLAADWQLTLRVDALPFTVPRPQRRDLTRPVAPQPTVISLHERLRGEVLIEGERFSAEIEGHFAPTAIDSLRRLPRILEQPQMRLTFTAADGQAHVLECKGRMQMLHRERSSLVTRVLRVTDLARRRLRNLMDSGDGTHTLLNFLALCSHVGAVRTMRYEWTVISGELPLGRKPVGPGDRFALTKRIEFTETGNPWRQLSEGRLDRLIGQQVHKLGTMVLDLDFFVEQLTPLLRIESQQDQPNALGDIAELALLMLRVVMRIHLLNMLPELERVQNPHLRLPGEVAGIAPQVADVEPPLPLDPRLGRAPRRQVSRYQPATPRPATRPVLLIHGYGASGSTFAHKDIGRNLVEVLLASGREVWVLDLRTSIGLEQRVYWSFEEVALGDIPPAVAQVLARTATHADGRVDIVAHCIAGAMLSVAMLKDAGLHRKAGTLVISQVGPLLRMSPYNRARGFVMSYLKQYLGQGIWDVDTDDALAPVALLTDALLATFPYPDGDGEADRLQTHPGFAAVRHRADGIFGQTMKLANISDELLGSLNSIYGWVMVEGLAQVIHYAREQLVTGTGGANEVIAFHDIVERFNRPLLMLHGRENAIYDWRGSHDTVLLMQQIFDGTSRVGNGGPLDEKAPRRLKLIEDYGHQDCLIGKNAHRDVFPYITAFLDEMASHQPQEAKGKAPLVAELPFTGPWLGRASLQGGELHCRVTLRAPLARASAVALLLVPAHREAGGWRFDIADTVGMATSIGELVDTALALRLDARHLAAYDGFAVVTLHDDLPQWHAKLFPTPSPTNKLFLHPNLEPDKEDLAALRRRLDASSAEAIDLAVVHLEGAWIDAAATPPQPTRLAIALASCQYPPGLVDRLPASRSLERLALRIESLPASERPQALWLLGDQVYLDDTAGLFDPAGASDAERAYRLNMALPAFRRVAKRLPTYPLLDDHEVVDNWEPESPLGAGHAAALEAYVAHQHKAVALPAQAPFDHRQTLAGIPVYAIDARSTRERRSLRSIAGASTLDDASIHAQRGLDDLLAWLAAAPADLPKLIASSVTVFPLPRAALDGNGDERIALDDWSGYPRSLFLLLDFIRRHTIRNVVLLSGDRHTSSVSSLWMAAPDTAAAPIEVVSVVSSGLHAPWPFANARPDEYWLDGKFTLRHGAQTLEAEVITAATSAVQGFALLALVRERSGWRIDVSLDGEDRVQRVGRLLGDSGGRGWSRA